MSASILRNGSRFTNVNVYRNRLGLEVLAEVKWFSHWDSDKTTCAAAALVGPVKELLPEVDPAVRKATCFALAKAHFELRGKTGNLGTTFRNHLVPEVQETILLATVLLKEDALCSLAAKLGRPPENSVGSRVAHNILFKR